MRNRSEGWKHAKISGHRNEVLIAEKIMNDSDFSNQLKTILKKSFEIKKAETDGLKNKKVIDVFGTKTIQKTDLKIFWENNSFTNFSIKKSKAGQVFLISFENFIKGFELQFNLKIPKDVKRALSLFINGAKDIESILLNEKYQKTDKKILEEISSKKFSFVHFDFDLFVPTSEAIKFIKPKLAQNAILLFDDYNNINQEGVKHAVKESGLDVSKSIQTQSGQLICWL